MSKQEVFSLLFDFIFLSFTLLAIVNPFLTCLYCNSCLLISNHENNSDAIYFNVAVQCAILRHWLVIAQLGSASMGPSLCVSVLLVGRVFNGCDVGLTSGPRRVSHSLSDLVERLESLSANYLVLDLERLRYRMLNNLMIIYIIYSSPSFMK